MGKLRDQMLADLQLRGATPRTQKTYLREVGNLAKYFNRSPAELGEDELKEYRLYLMKERHLSNLLFRSVSETLMKLASDQKHLGARIGAIGILHTWGQNLMDHPHIHCIVAGGGLSTDGSRWVSCGKGFFFHVKVMSALFRGKFLDHLKHCFQRNDLVFPGSISHLKEPGDFDIFRKQFYKKGSNWLLTD